MTILRPPGRLIAGLLITTALGLTGCSDEPATTVPPRAAPAELDTVVVEEAVVPRETLFDGVVEAVNESTVSAQTSGRVTELNFDVGDYVPKGEVIVRITDTEQRARVASAESALAEARARLTEARLAFERTRDVYERQLIAKAQLDAAAADLEAAQARVEAADAALAEARQNLEYTTIRAPYAGTVVERHVQMGEAVSPGELLMTGLSLEHLRVVVEIPQQHIGPLRMHSEARVLLNGDSLPAASLRIPPKADSVSHTFRVLVTLPEGDYGVFPGTLVKVAFVSGEHRRLLIPESAVVRRGELTAAYVVAEDGGVSLRYLRTATPTADGQVPVLSGLAAGERVALDPLAAGTAYSQQRAVAAGPAGGKE